jgi:trehalose 6-phosphate synthase
MVTSVENVVVVSNRGPLAFSYGPDGTLVARRGAGGLVASLGPLVAGTGAGWVAAAITDADREAAARGLVEAEGFRLWSLALDPDDYRMAYDVVSNATLWFLHHGIYDLARRPLFDRRWRDAWAAYQRVNRAFAATTAEVAPPGGVVLVQDYHLSLVGYWLRQHRPDLHLVHFSHTPFCGPNSIRVLPEDCAAELLVAMSAYTACGFHTERWARAFRACCTEVTGAAPPTFVSPLGPDADALAEAAASEEVAAEGTWVETVSGGRRIVLRVDRLELSKNLLRGFHAFDDLLRTHPEWRGRVVFIALVYPSREGLPEYLAYRNEVEHLAARLNERWGTDDWTPVVLDTTDNYPRSVAALQRYDVLLVNPVRDGMNLVAKEGPLLNRVDGAVVLSREAGAWDELAPHALEINPFDVAGTADALARALALTPAERAARARALAAAAGARSPRDWLADQLAAAGLEPPAAGRGAPRHGAARGR